MENITSGLTSLDITANTTKILSAFSPYLTLVVGILFAFFIITKIISFMTEAQDNVQSGRVSNLSARLLEEKASHGYSDDDLIVMESHTKYKKRLSKDLADKQKYG